MVSTSLSLARSWIGRRVTVRVDRPLGSRHPSPDESGPGLTYLVNYGYVPGVIAPDGEELDAYVLGVEEPLATFSGRCVAIVHRLDDDDDKLVVVPNGVCLSDDDILAQIRFQERFFDSRILRA